jgi:hypothetical protein
MAEVKTTEELHAIALEHAKTKWRFAWTAGLPMNVRAIGLKKRFASIDDPDSYRQLKSILNLGSLRDRNSIWVFVYIEWHTGRKRLRGWGWGHELVVSELNNGKQVWMLPVQAHKGYDELVQLTEGAVV